MSSKHTGVHRPGVTAFTSFVAQAKIARFVSTKLLLTLYFGLNPDDATGGAMDRSLIGRGERITPSFVGPFCMSACAQSIAQP